MHCVYVDLDGTLLWPGGSLVRDAEGRFSLLAVRALEACARAGVEVVPVSGRRRAQLFELGRLLSLKSYVAELGGIVVVDGEAEMRAGEMQAGELSIHDQITASGALDLLLDRYSGRLEQHDPWHHDREVTHLLRGLVDVDEVQALLAEHGHGELALLDNGAVRRRSPALAELPEVHAYHLLPRGTSKAYGVARHMQARGYAPGDCIAVGDSAEDAGLADVVGTLWLVANALERDGGLGAITGGRANVRVAEESYGAGVYEAVITTLAERRG